jgi:CRP-like cAMP-binding protein
MSHQIDNKCLFASSIREQLKADEFIQLLTTTTTFRDIPPHSMPLAVLEDVCNRTDVIVRAKNEPLDLVSEGDYLFEILSGYVKICDPPGPNDPPGMLDSERALLAWRIPGELLGDFKFALHDIPGNDQITVTDECRLLRIPTPLVHELALTFPQIYFNIASNLASKARKAGIRAQILRIRTLRGKVAQLFIELIAERKTSEESPGQHVLNGTFRVDELAAFIGYEERSTGGVISEMRNLGLIEHYNNKMSGQYEIRNEAGLRDYLECHLT